MTLSPILPASVLLCLLSALPGRARPEILVFVRGEAGAPGETTLVHIDYERLPSVPPLHGRPWGQGDYDSAWVSVSPEGERLRYVHYSRAFHVSRDGVAGWGSDYIFYRENGVTDPTYSRGCSLNLRGPAGEARWEINAHLKEYPGLDWPYREGVSIPSPWSTTDGPPIQGSVSGSVRLVGWRVDPSVGLARPSRPAGRGTGAALGIGGPGERAWIPEPGSRLRIFDARGRIIGPIIGPPAMRHP